MVWDSIFDQSCKSADVNNDKILEEDETQELLDLTYEAIEQKRNEVQWVEEDEE